LENNPAVPAQVSENAQLQLADGIPFVSDADLETALADAGVPAAEAQAIVDENETARIDALRSSLAVLALIAAAALFLAGRIPSTPVSQPEAAPAASP